MKLFQVIVGAMVTNLVSTGHQGGSYGDAAGLPTSYGVPSAGYGGGVGGYDGAAGNGNGGGYDNSVGYDNNGGGGYAGGAQGGNGYGGVKSYDEQPKAYQFGYAVRDRASGNDYGRHEASDGNVVQGEYRVQLPDGRLQIVTYTADWRNGFRADVRYEGEARYPDGIQQQQQQQQAGAGRPVYGPPGYHQ
ncbi:pro-resilin-like [Bacillus rossius redtenbacheri]|uniref:pro-resilin-like n=1 Tax=Bacillus rossius redtenbacheri TaxID=93214 RepID=UPI002FDD26AA